MALLSNRLPFSCALSHDQHGPHWCNFFSPDPAWTWQSRESRLIKGKVNSLGEKWVCEVGVTAQCLYKILGLSPNTREKKEMEGEMRARKDKTILQETMVWHWQSFLEKTNTPSISLPLVTHHLDLFFAMLTWKSLDLQTLNLLTSVLQASWCRCLRSLPWHT